MDRKPFEKIAIVLPSMQGGENYIFKAKRIALSLSNNIDYLVQGDSFEEQNLYKDLSGVEIRIKRLNLNSDGFVRDVLEFNKENHTDLLIMLAEKRQPELERYYEQSPLRQLLRKSYLSILLISETSQVTYRKALVESSTHPKNKTTQKMAKSVVQALGIEKLSTVEAEMSDLHDSNKVRQNNQMINKGYSIYQAVQSSASDLLVISSPDTKLGFADRVFSDLFEYLISEPPSDIFIVHSTKKLPIEAISAES